MRLSIVKNAGIKFPHLTRRAHIVGKQFNHRRKNKVLPALRGTDRQGLRRVPKVRETGSRTESGATEYRDQQLQRQHKRKYQRLRSDAQGEKQMGGVSALPVLGIHGRTPFL